MTHSRPKTPRRDFGRFCRDASGGVATIFAISATVLIAFIGAGLDMSRAYIARQQLSNVATLTCQYAARPAVMATAYGNTNGPSAYATQVNSFATKMLSNQNFNLTQTNAAPFTYAGIGGSGSVSLAASVPTLFLPIVSINALPVGVTQSCAANVIESTANTSGNVLSESFENSACSGNCFSTFNQDGTQNAPPTNPVTTFSSQVGYVGVGGVQWSIMGYCLEVDYVGRNKSTVPDGTHSAELDCDNGGHSAGNSSISNKSYYAAGTYELRYSFTSRVAYPNYDPTYICGSTATDVSWANDTYTGGSWSVSSAYRTNQINVYFDPDASGSAPTHTTHFGQTLAGSDLIDVCVQSINWAQRSVKITVTTAGYYWLSFAADGANDSYGGQIDNIMVCRTSCSGSVQDNFPSAWTTTPQIFEETFESPTWTNLGGYNSLAKLDASYASTPGWPAQQQTGWITTPYDQIDYILNPYYLQGSQSIELDSDYSLGQTTSNRSINRLFYLDPGYYRVDYDYISDFTFSGSSSTYCVADPTTSSSLSAVATTSVLAGKYRIGGLVSTAVGDTSQLAVFMSHYQLVSDPISSGVLNAADTYLNPNGTTTSSPTTPNDSVSVASYNTSQNNPVIDFCGYSGVQANRTAYVKIVKPGAYWLTFSALGTADQTGANVDDIRLTALNSLYGSAPSAYVAVPTPTPANGSTISYTGFSIVADALTP
jgi:hypothetical protein